MFLLQQVQRHVVRSCLCQLLWGLGGDVACQALYEADLGQRVAYRILGDALVTRICGR